MSESQASIVIDNTKEIVHRGYAVDGKVRIGTTCCFGTAAATIGIMRRRTRRRRGNSGIWMGAIGTHIQSFNRKIDKSLVFEAPDGIAEFKALQMNNQDVR